ncbi:unnamed protein product [Orchesella dallaii]|uniref:Uncharacterized protein n=1 Tax=Orchesella dallaii TaxID=48710 RepID=A0ABP1R708_9HEXA
MLRVNKCVRAGLYNGSIGTVRQFTWTALRREQDKEGDLPESISVEFDNEISRDFIDSNGWVKIEPRKFEYTGNRGTDVTRAMLPVILAWGATINKCQIFLMKKHLNFPKFHTNSMTYPIKSKSQYLVSRITRLIAWKVEQAKSKQAQKHSTQVATNGLAEAFKSSSEG